MNSDLTAIDSLEALRAEHGRLLKADRKGTASQDLTEKVNQFLMRAKELGRRLDAPNDRDAAQSVLDYWTAMLFTLPGGVASKSTLPSGVEGSMAAGVNVVLDDFDAATIKADTARADQFFGKLNADEQRLAQRLLMRLVRLEPDGRTFRPETVTFDELHKLGARDRIDAIVDGLRQAGVLKVDAAEAPGSARVSLRFEAVTRAWKPYAEWLDQRLRFRDAVHFWEASDRDSSVLIRDQLLNDALDYEDLSELEEAFIKASRNRESDQNQRNLRAKYIFGTLAIVALLLAAVSIRQWRRAEAETDRATTESKEAIKQKGIAEEQTALAQKQKGIAEEQTRLATAESDRAEAAAAQATKAAAALKAKSDLVNIVALIRTLAEIGTASSEDEWQIGVKRLEILTEGLKDNPDFARMIEQLKPEIVRLQRNAASRQVREKLAHQALNAGRSFRDRALAVKDPDLIKELEARRTVTYGMARFCGERIVETLEEKTFGDADAYVKEFWLLYWGELSVLEGERVQGAMVAFGEELKKLDESVASKIPDVEKLMGSVNSKWGNQQVRQAVSNLRARTQLDEELNTVVQELSRRKVPPEEVEVVKKILHERLIPALDAELKEPFAPSQSLPKTY